MSPSTPRPVRNAKDVIDSAISENGFAEKLCYCLIVLFVSAGFFILIYGAMNKEGIVSIAGAVTSGLFWPALNAVRRIREQNLAIRLLEIPLRNKQTSKEAAQALREVFLGRFNNPPQKPD